MLTAAFVILAIAAGAAGGRLLPRRRLALSPAEKRCACPTDEEGILRCEGVADPRCVAGCCPVHCAKFCKGDCQKKAVRQREQCSSAYKDAFGNSQRCGAFEDPRCKGGNCTEHCKKRCGGACLH